MAMGCPARNSSPTGRLCTAFGARVVMTMSGVAGSAMLSALGLARSPATLGLLLIALGAMVGVMDVAMNVAGVTATRRTGRAIMPLFHAAFAELTTEQRERLDSAL